MLQENKENCAESLQIPDFPLLNGLGIMEHDRFEQNKVLFIIGMIALVVGLSFLLFSFYILPAALWNWNYDVPEFVFIWRENLKESYTMSEVGAGGVVFLIVLLPAIIAGIISYFISNAIDNRIHGIVNEEMDEESMVNLRQDVKETFSFGGKLIILIILAVVALWFFEWLMAVPIID